MRRLLALAASAVIVAASTRALAYRPFDETDASVTPTGEVELELGPFGYTHDPAGGTLTPGFIVNWGAVPRLELVLDAHNSLLFDGPDLAARRRALDTSVTGKYVVRQGVLQGAAGPSVAVEGGPILPTIPAAGGVGLALTGIVSERWTAGAVHVDAETDLTRDHRFAFIGGAIGEGPDAWSVRPVAEVLFVHTPDVSRTISGLAGAIWRASERLSFDAAGRVARADDATIYELRLGLTWAFEI
jgi:hypothetical protein